MTLLNATCAQVNDLHFHKFNVKYLVNFHITYKILLLNFYVLLHIISMCFFLENKVVIHIVFLQVKFVLTKVFSFKWLYESINVKFNKTPDRRMCLQMMANF